jgi:transposase-like protein
MRAPALAVGDGALRFRKALREILPDTRKQRCWVHKATNVLDVLPKSAQPAAKAALAEIWGVGDRQHAAASLAAFARQ